ncbi:MAG: SGNH/GDSL hydrolase family protein [Phycisphaerales bacterium]|nr:SGNH/GDSL hydrolase family protein [Phycisphaerales bacterium]
MMLNTGLLLIAVLMPGLPDPGTPIFKPHDRIAIVGNTFAERMQLDGQFESLLQASHPDHELSIRNFGWSGDEVALQPRPLNFLGMDEWLDQHDTDVIIACFGMNESYSGDEGLPKFRKDLDAWIEARLSKNYNNENPPRIILVSPIAHEDLGDPLPDGHEHNFVLQSYSDAMRQAAVAHEQGFIDLFTPTLETMKRDEVALTINGIHPNRQGYRVITCAMADQLGLVQKSGAEMDVDEVDIGNRQHEALRQAVLAKNRLFFQRWRPVNTEYVYGRRHEPYGSKNFPDEMKQLDRLVEEADRTIWTMPPGHIGCEVIEEEY